jgi:hypothetical protein
MDVSLSQAFRWFCAAHGVGEWGPACLPDDSTFYELVFDGIHPAEKVYDTLLEENRVHRVHLDLSILSQLRMPDAECQCAGTGTFHVVGGLYSLCERCMCGEEASTWIVPQDLNYSLPFSRS